MPDAHVPEKVRPVLQTRLGVGVVRCVFVFVVWPFLTCVIGIAGVMCALATVTTLDPESAETGGWATDFVGFVLGGPIFVMAAIAAAVISYKSCRFLTVPQASDSPPP